MSLGGWLTLVLVLLLMSARTEVPKSPPAGRGAIAPVRRRKSRSPTLSGMREANRTASIQLCMGGADQEYKDNLTSYFLKTSKRELLRHER